MSVEPPRVLSLAQWQARADEELERGGSSPLLWWIRVVGHAGNVARAIRAKRVTDLAGGELLALPLVAALKFAAAVGFDLDDALWAKYPAVCPYCIYALDDFEELATRPPSSVGPDCRGLLEPCSCPPPPKRGQFDANADWLTLFRSRTDVRPSTIGQWQSLFHHLYGHRHTVLEALGYHFIEELGEVASELDVGDVSACALETADVVSWILSIANSASRELQVPVSVEDAAQTALMVLREAARSTPAIE